MNENHIHQERMKEIEILVSPLCLAATVSPPEDVYPRNVPI